MQNINRFILCFAQINLDLFVKMMTGNEYTRMDDNSLLNEVEIYLTLKIINCLQECLQVLFEYH